MKVFVDICEIDFIMEKDMNKATCSVQEEVGLDKKNPGMQDIVVGLGSFTLHYHSCTTLSCIPHIPFYNAFFFYLSLYDII